MAAVVEPERKRVEVLTVDGSSRACISIAPSCRPDAIGHRALAVNLSDLAAMGAAPRLALVSMALPGGAAAVGFRRDRGPGLRRSPHATRLAVVGGNLTRSRVRW